MVMITCPRCGQHVLDVASSCPKCGHVLLQNPLEAGEGARLVNCGRCGKHIDRDAVRCPYCGYHTRRARLLWRSVWVLCGIAVVAAALTVAARRGLLDGLRRDVAERVARPVEAPQRAAVRDTPVVAAPLHAVPAGSGSRIDSAAVSGRPLPTPAPPTPPSPTRAPGTLVSRWTAEWANLRAGRGLETAVLRVLAPRVRVEVADMQRGWWAVYSDGVLIGYIANSVLSEGPPQP